MRDAATLARDTSGGLRALEGKIDGLQRSLDALGTRAEPALQAHAAYLAQLTAEDNRATAEAKAAAAVAAANAATAKIEADTKAAQERAQLRSLIIQIVLTIGGLLVGGGAVAALGGSP
jgi:membrane protein involved in colicin uptake